MKKYEIVEEFLREEIQKPEAMRRLPTVRALMAKFSVSMATVLHALQNLENENLLVRRHGSGITAVRPDSIDADALRNTAGRRKVVLAFIDYPSEAVWQTTLNLSQALRQRDFAIINYHICKETRISDIVEFTLESVVNCSGLVLFGIPDFTQADADCLGQLACKVSIVDSSLNPDVKLPENCRAFLVNPSSGVKLAVDCFIKNGHTRIGFVRNEPYSDYCEMQIECFLKLLAERNLPVSRNHIFSKQVRPWDDSRAVAQAIVRENLERIRKMEITALFVASSTGAMSMIDPLRKSGVSVPDDISLIAEGNLSFCKYLSPPLTTTGANYYDIAEMAIGFLSGRLVTQKISLFDQTLFEGESVATL